MSLTTAIIGLGTALPTCRLSQDKYIDFMRAIGWFSEKEISRNAAICSRAAIDFRHTVASDFALPAQEQWELFSTKKPQETPSTHVRNELYKKYAPELAKKAAQAALADWGGEVGDITHIIVVSCTGMMAPGIEFLLIDELGLAPNVQRYGLNFMGCFGAIRGLACAKAFAKESPKNRVLLICVELCTLHWQAQGAPDTMIANLIFSDGAAAAIVGAPTLDEKALWYIEKEQALAIPNTLDKMSWDITNHGFVMRLAFDVGLILAQTLPPYLAELIGKEISPDTIEWALHPGGKAIILAIEAALNISRKQTHASWEILAQYGNMSSGTLLFVLNHLRACQPVGEHTVALAFGPGLSLEGLLLKRGT